MGAASYESILFEQSEGVATITLNRPDKLNAYTPEMGNEVVAAFRAAREDDAVRVVVLTGAGRGFCAGVDLDRLKQMHAEAARGAESSGPKLGEEEFVRSFPEELLEYPKPTIAAINGAAIGVGVTMILPFDIRIAAEEAKLGVTFTKLGMLPGLGSTHLLPQLVGVVKAREMVLTARVLRAPEAAEIGLVNQVVPGAQLLETVRTLALDLAERDPAVMAAAKRALRFGASASMGEAMKNEQHEGAAVRASRAGR